MTARATARSCARTPRTCSPTGSPATRRAPATRTCCIVGDLNSYAKEDPIAALEAEGYTNLVASRSAPDAYSYVFDGQWGYLDHALGTRRSVPQVTGVAEWHINADEPSVLDYNNDFKSRRAARHRSTRRTSSASPTTTRSSSASTSPAVRETAGPARPAGRPRPPRDPPHPRPPTRRLHHPPPNTPPPHDAATPAGRNPPRTPPPPTTRNQPPPASASPAPSAAPAPSNTTDQPPRPPPLPPRPPPAPPPARQPPPAPHPRAGGHAQRTTTHGHPANPRGHVRQPLRPDVRATSTARASPTRSARSSTRRRRGKKARTGGDRT